jgi:hypothetical protein
MRSIPFITKSYERFIQSYVLACPGQLKEVITRRKIEEELYEND